MLKPVIVCTEYKGVFFGYISTETPPSFEQLKLTNARMAIYWGTSRGVMELAETGPTNKSKISAKANIELRKIIAIFDVTPQAEEVWKTLV